MSTQKTLKSFTDPDGLRSSNLLTSTSTKCAELWEVYTYKLFHLLRETLHQTSGDRADGESVTPRGGPVTGRQRWADDECAKYIDEKYHSTMDQWITE